MARTSRRNIVRSDGFEVSRNVPMKAGQEQTVEVAGKTLLVSCGAEAQSPELSVSRLANVMVASRLAAETDSRPAGDEAGDEAGSEAMDRGFMTKPDAENRSRH
ncbi:MAG: hypothetical protein U1E62_00960 [Alsobacter sp.]